MRDIFRALMPLPPGNLEYEFDRAIIVLDTNVMLDMYRYSRPTSEHFLNLLEHIVERLWLPHQVGLEFLQRRAQVRDEQTANHSARIDELSKLLNRFESAEKKSHVGHDEAEEAFIDATKEYVEYLRKEREDIQAWARVQNEDPVLSAFERYYEGRTASRPTTDWTAESTTEGEKRFKAKVPPGYEDATKESNRFGDYFLWKECLKKCAEDQLPLVFVTGDVKADWWSTGKDKKRLGPRHELLQEFLDATGQHLFMLDTSQFFERLRETIQASATEEVEAAAAAQTEIDAAQAQRERRTRVTKREFDAGVWQTILSAARNRPAPDSDWLVEHSAYKAPLSASSDKEFTRWIIDYVRSNPAAFKAAAEPSTK